MEAQKKQALDDIAMRKLSTQEAMERLRIVFETPKMCHAAISFASSAIVRKAKSLTNDGTPVTSAIMKSLLDDIQYMKELAQCLTENCTKEDDYEQFL